MFCSFQIYNKYDKGNAIPSQMDMKLSFKLEWNQEIAFHLTIEYVEKEVGTCLLHCGQTFPLQLPNLSVIFFQKWVVCEK